MFFSSGSCAPNFSLGIIYSILQSEGQQLRYCGLGHSYDDILVKGNPAELKVRS